MDERFGGDSRPIFARSMDQGSWGLGFGLPLAPIFSGADGVPIHLLLIFEPNIQLREVTLWYLESLCTLPKHPGRLPLTDLVFSSYEWRRCPQHRVQVQNSWQGVHNIDVYGQIQVSYGHINHMWARITLHGLRICNYAGLAMNLYHFRHFWRGYYDFTATYHIRSAFNCQ